MKKIYFGLILTFVCAQAVFAQNITRQSYEKAREVLDKAVTAYGGLEKLRIENYTLKAVGDTVQRNQSRRTFMAEKTPYQIEITADLKNNRFIQIAKGGYPGGFSYHSGIAVDKADGVAFDFIRNSTSPVPNIPPQAFRARMRWLPQYWVVNALERASRLRYIGKIDFDKRAHNVVSYSNEDGAEVSLYFDEKTNLLSKFETVGTDPFAGDTVFETIYTGYKNESGQQMPLGRITKVDGEPTQELRFELLAFNTALTDDKFKAPANFTPAAANPAPQPLNKISENVYTVTAGGYNVLFVAFKDYIFVMEAPGNDFVSRQAIDQIKKTFPNKPIKYVSVTHHHDDHAGGIRTYIAEGATIIAAPGEKAFFEKIAKAKFTIDADALTRNPQPLIIETIEGGKRVLTDGATTVEIYDIGSGPHTDEMLVAYLPNEKIIFQGDLLNRPANGDTPIANDTTAHFAKWLDAKKLAIDKIIAVHGPSSTLEELKKAVADLSLGKK